MDINLSVVSGRLALAPLVEHQPDGSVVARMLVLVRPERRGRVDVIPVTMASPPPGLLADGIGSGTGVYFAGALMRRCTVDIHSDSTRLELVADSMALWNNND